MQKHEELDGEELDASLDDHTDSVTNVLMLALYMVILGAAAGLMVKAYKYMVAL
jgi:hypothetical protein